MFGLGGSPLLMKINKDYLGVYIIGAILGLGLLVFMLFVYVHKHQNPAESLPIHTTSSPL